MLPPSMIYMVTIGIFYAMIKKNTQKGKIMAGRRPRTTTPPPEQCIELGKKLVKWATEKTPAGEPLRSRFCEWYTLPEIGMIQTEWKLLIQVEEFWLYYEQAQAALGRKFIDGTINPSVGHRLMWHYVPEAREQEFEKMEKEASLKLKETHDIGTNIREIAQALKGSS